ncbi:hypothetical protein FNF27_08042 [Cafeteria roenbergensis]|uniref:Uncharacterized protein n=1 Tax=Cafeteria roenbergensis TaxID=33653 RepID=A0A5A8DCC4_CAFRO|nr:hypothetical protein FNF27_08042 [Cafeteria roenbergensis]
MVETRHRRNGGNEPPDAAQARPPTGGNETDPMQRTPRMRCSWWGARSHAILRRAGVAICACTAAVVAVACLSALGVLGQGPRSAALDVVHGAAGYTRPLWDAEGWAREEAGWDRIRLLGEAAGCRAHGWAPLPPAPAAAGGDALADAGAGVAAPTGSGSARTRRVVDAFLFQDEFALLRLRMLQLASRGQADTAFGVLPGEGNRSSPVTMVAVEADTTFTLAPKRLLLAEAVRAALEAGVGPLAGWVDRSTHPRGVVKHAAVTVWPGWTGRLQEWWRHSRRSDILLGAAGWHCSWCFRRVAQAVNKALTYSHSDRAHRPDHTDPAAMQRRMCSGADPFDQVPEVYTLAALADATISSASEARDATDVPALVARQPWAVPWLLPGRCEREDAPPGWRGDSRAN